MPGPYRHLVSVWNPGAVVPDADGNPTQTLAAATPGTWHCSITPASARDLERTTAGTVLSSTSHIVEGHYHPGITTRTELVKSDGRRFYVNGVQNPEERNIRTIALCSEVVT